MNNISIDYVGIEGDISTLENNISTINTSLDSINNIDKIIPSSWKSPAADKYREVATSDILKLS